MICLEFVEASGLIQVSIVTWVVTSKTGLLLTRTKSSTPSKSRASRSSAAIGASFCAATVSVTVCVALGSAPSFATTVIERLLVVGVSLVSL